MRQFLIAVFLLLPLTASADTQLSQREYQLLIKAFKFIESEQYTAAHKQLMLARSQVRSDYARALVSHNLGQVELQREDYSKALGHLGDAYKLQALPEDQQNNLVRTLAQLNCIEEKWQACATHLEHWMKEVSNKVKADDQLLLAQAYSQLEKWSKVVKPIDAAISHRKIAPESWYQLKVVAHIRLKQWKAAIRGQKRMISHYADNPAHWRQLVSLHLQARDSKSALADQRIGFERGLLRKAGDYRLLAQMMLQAAIPYYAGQVLQQGMDKGVLSANKKNLALLSQCWIQARESQRALSVLAKLNRLAPSQKTLTQIAHIQIQLQNWQAAQGTLLQAIKAGQGQQPQLQLLLGIARIKLKNYEQARRSLTIAANDNQIKATANGWMRYLDQINPNDSPVSAS
ncbi:lipopolysaccharide assembly protein LapB [Motiliproteus sp. MSK22-1]|uniref:tetratricopeptide repeat protein n=1 Tax=Motiliproteus sp. MSK22-1 TaxID=1897630 RepID=UPI000975C0EB|nr:hypothetical protein [Motiliproteus sp. MSK22-1]OMH33670.1 hypothetical protein BGP75_11725 [Motiliproteus sp. MSK22-1]